MQCFAFFVNLFFATPQNLQFLLSTQLLDFVVVFSRRRIIANLTGDAQGSFFAPKFALSFPSDWP
jgi:hypothetical protein